MAASQCPKCSHLFDVRDGFGEMVPLSYCSACDSYYPASVGSCRWCGTKPEPEPNAPRIWKGVGVGALVVIVGIGWMMRDSRPKRAPEPTQLEQIVTPAPTPVVASTPPAAIAPAETIAAPTQVATTVAPSDAVAPSPEPRSVAPPPAPAPIVEPAAKVATTTPPKARASARWVNSVSRSWVVVRAGPSKGSRLVASIGPNSRVQLGESQGDWRRIKAKGITGWVESRASFAAARSPGRPRVVVSR